MDEKLVSELIQDMHDAIGYKPIPEHAAQIKELRDISGLSYEFARKAVAELVASGAWKKGRKGNKSFYWKVQDG